MENMSKAQSSIVNGEINDLEVKQLLGELRDGAMVAVICSNLNSISETIKYEDIGFEVKDTLYWSHISTATKKPVLTPVLLLRKPIKEQNIALNMLKNGTGVINVDALRISYAKGDTNKPSAGRRRNIFGTTRIIPEQERRGWQPNIKGRYPTNTIFSKKLLPVNSNFTSTTSDHVSSLIKLLTVLVKPKNSRIIIRKGN